MVSKEVKGVVETKGRFVKWFSELSNKDVSIAGGKGASLAEMYNNKFPIPPGFMVTAEAYKYFIEKSGLIDEIKKLSEIDVEDTKALEEGAKKIRELISNAQMPAEMEEEIKEDYDMLDVDKQALSGASSSALTILKNSHEPPFVAVRSSATAEDLADASFAGQQESFINVKGAGELIQKVKECFASLFTARAVYYRNKKKFSNETTYLAVVVQKMVNSDKSGVMFSRSPVGDEKNIMIEAVWGLGEGIVSGMIKPDSYLIDRKIEDFKILDLKVSEKKVAIVRNSAGENQIVKLTQERAKQQVLNNYELKTLAQYSLKLEEHYKKPQDIEFAIEGRDIYIVQSRPITTLGKETKGNRELGGEILLSGLAASPGIGSGVVKIVLDLKDLDRVKKGDVLVTKMTNPDMVVTMQKAAAIVTDEGGITSHAAIVSREMGIPAVVGTEEATGKLKEGQIITVDGFAGKVYEGSGETKAVEINPVVPTKTKIKVVVDLPEYAERAAKSGAKEVGLTRIEGIIASSGKHPLYFLKKNALGDYVELLYKGIKNIVEHFEGIWIRTSDIRSDEYVHLEGAPKEPEGNPMLGNHGIRFGIKNRDVLKAEVTAAIKVALEFPGKKIGIMMPQVISVGELIETKKIAEEIGKPENVVIGIMVETPAAVQIINDLCEEGIGFISFGTNDLTQYILAIDRNNSEVQYLYDEMNPAVLSALSYVIRRCKKYGVETSICGQAGSKEEMVKFLVKEGISSISVNADAAENISKLVAKMEAGVTEFVNPIEEKADSNAQIEEATTNAPEMQEKKEEKKEDLKEIVNELKELETAEGGIIAINPFSEVTGDFLGVKKEEKTQENQDIEDIVLKELDKDEHENYDYGSANQEKKNDIPPLNDSIPVESVFETKPEKLDEIKIE